MSATANPQAAEPSPDTVQRVFQLMTGHMISGAVQVVARLGIADRLAAAPRSADDLARETGVNADALYRVLRSLASVGLFEEVSPRTFRNTAAEALREGPLRALALWLTHPFNVRAHTNTMHSVKTGESAVPATYGMGAFEYLAEHPDVSQEFNNAMTGLSTVIIGAVLEAYDFSGIGTLVDVAGGHGAILTAILQRYPRMKGILFDVDHVIEGAKAKIAAQGLSDRCSTESGDFFRAVPAGGDAYLMKHIIHDWYDDKAATILRNIRAVLPQEGRLILLESVIPPGNEPAFGKILDLEMLVMPGGKERTEAEFRQLFDTSGFTLTRIVPTKSPLCVIEAKPK